MSKEGLPVGLSSTSSEDSKNDEDGSNSNSHLKSAIVRNERDGIRLSSAMSSISKPESALYLDSKYSPEAPVCH